MTSAADVEHDLPLLEEYLRRSAIRVRIEVPFGRGRLVWDRVGAKGRDWRIVEETQRRRRHGRPYRHPLTLLQPYQSTLVDDLGELGPGLVKLALAAGEAVRTFCKMLGATDEDLEREASEWRARNAWAAAWK